MKPIFLIVENKKSLIHKDTLESLKENSYKVIKDFESIFDLDLKEYTHAILIPNGDTVATNYFDLMNVYFEEDTILMPLVFLNHPKSTGVLNTCIWNSNINPNIGELSFDVAQYQIDLTLFGAMIPVKFFKKEYFDSEIKYYQQYYFLNKVTAEDILVKGVPKVTATISVDLLFEDVSKEEKTIDFKKAKDVKLPETEDEEIKDETLKFLKDSEKSLKIVK